MNHKPHRLITAVGAVVVGAAIPIATAVSAWAEPPAAGPNQIHPGPKGRCAELCGTYRSGPKLIHSGPKLIHSGPMR